MSAPAAPTAGTTSGMPPRRNAALAAAVASLLAGCSAGTGDFGRPVASLADQMQAALPAPLRPPGPPFAPDTLTMAEHEARDRLWHFRQTVPALPPTSATARFNAIADHIAGDIALIAALQPLRAEVAGKTAIRAGALAGLTQAEEKAQAHVGRVSADNALLFADFCRLAGSRARAFRVQLETQVLIAPEVAAIPAERRLLALEARVSEVCAGQGVAGPGEFGPWADAPAVKGRTQTGRRPIAGHPLVRKV